MNPLVPFHVAAGVLALAFGYAALLARKGDALHRRIGRYFAYSMMVMSLSGAVLAILKPTPPNVVAGLMTFYFVITGMLTVRKTPVARWISVTAMVAAAGIGVFAFQVGRAFAAAGNAEAGAMFLFGTIVFCGAIGDARVMRAGGIEGPRRLARHLWRMCFPMWIAAISFLVRVPANLHIPGAVLAVPVLTPLVVMAWWLWRLRSKRAGRAMVTAVPVST